MSSKLLIILATGEKQKALTGLMYANNAIKRGWMDSVQIVFFGPTQQLIVQDDEVASAFNEISTSIQPVACKAISDRDGFSSDLEKLGFQVEYVGSIISNLINEGYIPMVW